jgi:uncharacterized protein YbaP (TraB family)
MCGLFAAGIAALGLFASAPLAAQQAEAIDELDAVLVTGEHPGPGLWKVSKGDHVLWVLGTYEPLPKGMTWRSWNVESRIAESQEVMLPGVVDVQLDFDIGFFKAISLIPAAARADNIPGGKTLKDILPAETYGLWRRLSEKYMARSHSADKSRPSFAMDKLRTSAYRKQRLTDGPVVDKIVRNAAKKHKIHVRRLPDVVRSVRFENLEALLKNLRKLDNPDVECFTTSIARLEGDIEHMKALANAWAQGDVDALRTLHEQPEVGRECDNVMEMALTSGDSAIAESTRKMAAEYERKEAEGRIQLEASWIRAARAALDRNLSTFAVLPIREVVAANGYVAKLAELGYEVEGQ